MPERVSSLPVGEAHVWWARAADARPSLELLLDDVERDRLAAYRRAEDRARFLVGCSLAKIVLGAYLDRPPAAIRLSRTCPECGKPHGKPAVAEPRASGIELSVSHGGELVAVAFAVGAPVGVDVERLDAELRVGELERVALSASERQALAALEPEARARAFLVWWTRKEAATKATGAGLRLSPDSVVVTAPGEAPRLVEWAHEVPPEEVALFDLTEREGHVAALAVLGRCDAVSELDGSQLVAAAP